MGLLAQLSESVEQATVVPWDEVGAELQKRINGAIAPTASKPNGVVYPETTAALSEVMALASQQSWRVLTMGQGSKLSWGGLAEGIDLVVSTARLNRVVEHAVGDFTVTVEPGVQFSTLQQQLAAHRQFLAIDPAFSSQATVGGLVATADAGSLRQRYGGLRDMLIGVQFVRHDGEVARAGGRVVKNVAGYDLMKLMTGAYGSLGILSELTFRLYPMQAVSRTLVLSGGETALEQAVAELRLSGLTPVAMDVTLARLTDKLTGSDSSDHMGLVARFQGIADGVEEQSARLEKVATTHGMRLQQFDGEQDTHFWQGMNGLIRSESVLCKVGMRPGALPTLLAQLEAPVNEQCEVLLHGGSGLGWVQWPAEMAVEMAEGDALKQEIEKVRSHCQNNGGFLTLLQAPTSLKDAIDVWGYTGNALKVMGDIKQKFDPQRLLSPGRFVGGL